MKRDFGNEEFKGSDKLSSANLNSFFKQELDRLPIGSILLPAHGQAANASYAVKKGWEVAAFDDGDEGYKKALELAQTKNVDIRYFIDGFEEAKVIGRYYDAVALIYAPIPAQKRTSWFEKMIKLLKPGAVVIFEGYAIDQLRYLSGGPRSNQMFFTEETIVDIFHSLSQMKVWKEEITDKNSSLHGGRTNVIRMLGVK